MQLRAKKREKTGVGLSDLRQHGLVPAVVYGKGFSNLNLTVDGREFAQIYQRAGQTSIVDLQVENEKETLKVLIADSQIEPIKNEIIHVDFHKVDLSQKVTAVIPLKFTGESSAVKGGEGILLILLNRVEVEALPLDLPHEISLDVSRLSKVGDLVAVKDLAVNATKVKILGHGPEDVVVKIDYAVQMEKEEEAKGVEEIEVLTEKKAEENAEGEAGQESAEDKSKSKEEAQTEKEEKKDRPTGPAGKKDKEKR